MTVKRLNFHHMSHLRFPSAAARATREWLDYDDAVDVPSLVLMENMERNGAEVVFLAFKNLHNLLNEAAAGLNQKVVSKVALVTMRSDAHRPMLPEPVRLELEHSTKVKGHTQCANWDEAKHAWSDRGCRAAAANETHTLCFCYRFGLVGVLTDASEGQGDEDSGMTVAVAVVLVAVILLCLIICAALGLDYFRRTRPVSGFIKKSLTKMKR